MGRGGFGKCKNPKYDHRRIIRYFYLNRRVQNPLFPVIGEAHKLVLRLKGDIREHKYQRVRPCRFPSQPNTNSDNNHLRLRNFPSKAFNEGRAFVRTTGEERGPFYWLKYQQ